MTGSQARFDRTENLPAVVPPEQRGAGRDAVRLMWSSGTVHSHYAFRDLPKLLQPGDVLVVNRSATLPASLPALLPERSGARSFLLNLSTRYDPRLWLAEPRWSPSEPGPVPLDAGERISVGGSPARVVGSHPRLARLVFVAFDEDPQLAMARAGRPIRYGYVAQPQPLEAYQTVFADRPGSAEMPSAARPFTEWMVGACNRRGIEIARLTLHTGVSSLESPLGADGVPDLYAEPFEVPPETARVVNRARADGRRVVAVGTTVVRALESAWNGTKVVPARGFTSRVVSPGRSHGVIDGLLTGLHEAGSSHLAMLCGVASRETVDSAYREAVAEGYLWHEFGDTHLLWASPESSNSIVRQAGV